MCILDEKEEKKSGNRQRNFIWFAVCKHPLDKKVKMKSLSQRKKREDDTRRDREMHTDVKIEFWENSVLNENFPLLTWYFSKDVFG